MISIRTILRTAYRPCPVKQSQEAMRQAAESIDRMATTVQRIRETSRNSAIDDISEARG